ncbi:hypothetical protein ACIRS1_05375 [Kitasatospora sp. NPDC101176]|uniref:hypothetical protein n=1 Tax=Kitasatospora sp. NPDC101176 TaxID=3364099 RepID=UPI00381050B4
MESFPLETGSGTPGPHGRTGLEALFPHGAGEPVVSAGTSGRRGDPTPMYSALVAEWIAFGLCPPGLDESAGAASAPSPPGMLTAGHRRALERGQSGG